MTYLNQTVEKVEIIYTLSDGTTSNSVVIGHFRLELEEREHEGKKQTRAVMTTAWADEQFFNGTEPS